MSITHKLHKVEILELENENYGFLVKCSCGHEERCNTEQVAKQLSLSHQEAQAQLRYTGGMRQGGI